MLKWLKPDIFLAQLPRSAPMPVNRIREASLHVVTFVSVVIILLLVATGPTRARRADVRDRIDALLARYQELGLFNGSALVADHGEVVLQQGLWPRQHGVGNRQHPGHEVPARLDHQAVHFRARDATGRPRRDRSGGADHTLPAGLSRAHRHAHHHPSPSQSHVRHRRIHRASHLRRQARTPPTRRRNLPTTSSPSSISSSSPARSTATTIPPTSCLASSSRNDLRPGGTSSCCRSASSRR